MPIQVIREARNNLHYTQDQVSKRLNIPLASYLNIEKGRHVPNVITALELCTLLNLNPFHVWLNHPL